MFSATKAAVVRRPIGRRRGLKIAAVPFLALVLPLNLLAGGIAQPRLLGLAGAGTATATGVDAIFVNPANLALPGQKRFELHLLGAGAFLYNSSVSLDFYNRYNGDSLDAGEKEDILSRFPDDGWKIGTIAEVPVFALKVGNFGLGAGLFIEGQIGLPKALVERPLYGIDMHQTYSFGPFSGAAIAFGKYTLAYALPLKIKTFDVFTVGAGLSFLHGLADAEVVESEGYFVNDYQGEIEWRLRTRTGFLGSGLGLDLGAAAVRKNLRVAIAMSHLFSRIRWKHHAEEQLVWLRADSLNVARFDTLKADEVFETGDSTYSIGSFSTSLPVQLSLGLAYEWQRLLFAFDYRQSFRSRYAHSTQPEFALGVESRYVRFLPLRLGFAFGGGKGFRPAFGFGIHVLGIRWDFAFSGVGSMIPSHMRGIGFATSLRIAH